MSKLQRAINSSGVKNVRLKKGDASYQLRKVHAADEYGLKSGAATEIILWNGKVDRRVSYSLLEKSVENGEYTIVS